MELNSPADNPSLSLPLPDSRTILVVTGGRGVGKTIFCQAVVDEYRLAGLKISGLLSPGRYQNHKRNGIFTIDLAGGQSQLAASLVPGEIDGIRFGAWNFDPKVFEWGNRCLIQSTETDVLVIDELGYLEFDLSTGWTASFEVLKNRNYRLAIVVIRPECLEAFSNLGFSFQTRQVFSPPPPSR